MVICDLFHLNYDIYQMSKDGTFLVVPETIMIFIDINYSVT